MPPVSGGRPAMGSVASASTVAAEGVGREAGRRHADGRLADPVRLTVPLGERRPARDADERPARPDPAVLGRLEQEGAGPLAGELAVDADRGLAVGHESAHDGDDPAVPGEHAEDVERGPGLPVGQVRRGRRGRCRAHASLTTAPRSSASKQVRAPVWQAGADLVDPHEQGVAVAVEGHRRARTGRGRRCRPCASTRRGCATRR